LVPHYIIYIINEIFNVIESFKRNYGDKKPGILSYIRKIFEIVKLSRLLNRPGELSRGIWRRSGGPVSSLVRRPRRG
jgi:hypothetical protein